jgi:agmatinase
MVDSIINCRDNKKADAIILGVGYDKTSSFRKGASEGPSEIVKCLDTKVELFERFTGTEPALTHKISYHELKNIGKLAPEKAVKRIAQEYEKLENEKNFVLMLGGEHSVSIGAFEYFSKRNNPEDVTIVHIDAHMDLREDDSDYNDKSPSKYSHGCVMRRALDLGFKTVQIGIRDYSRDEFEFVKKNGLTIFEWGKEEVKIETIINSIKTKKVYLTVDIDGLDPSCAPATGTPVPGGLDWSYASKLIRDLFKDKDVIGADIVEVAPRKEDVLTQYGAAQLCYSMLAHKFLIK